MADGRPCALLHDESGEGSRWLYFSRARRELVARRPGEVPAILTDIEQAVAGGAWAVGFLTYEAAPGLDPALVTRPAGSLPAAWFGLFPPPAEVGAPEAPDGPPPALEWEPSIPPAAHRRGVERIRRLIARGETYQVNYTLRLRTPFEGDARELFRHLWAAQRGTCAAYLDLGAHALCSVSPELFLALDGDRLVTRPMKGTAARGLWSEDDEARARALAASPKERAENLMIVDMVRNDLGRIAAPGSVQVPALWTVERYDSLFQLTSTVTAESSAGLGDLFAALFPSASITGAPKVRTMQIIAALEESPRGIYTGAVGYVAPGRRARFSVAIRTVHVDRRRGIAEYGTGGGVVWDSSAAAEHRETRTKALILTAAMPRPTLFETILWRPRGWRPRGGWFLLERHLERLEASARRFGLPFDRRAALARLAEEAAGLPRGAHRVRLRLAPDGSLETDSARLEPWPRPWLLGLAVRPVERDELLLYHKTTCREVYAERLAELPEGVHDALLWNRDGELTESTIANLVLPRGGRLVTPPVESGLLPGTYRAEALARGWLEEAPLHRSDLAGVTEVLLLNSVRGLFRARLVSGQGSTGDG